MHKFVTLLAVSLILTLTMISTPIQGKKPVDETLIIGSGGDEIYKLESNKGTEWTFQISSERPVTLKWFDEEDYEFYSKGETEKVYPIDSRDNVTDEKFEKTFQAGVFYFLIINEYNEKVTNVTVKVSYEETPGFTLPVSMAAGMGAVFIYRYFYRRERGMM